MAKGVQDKMRGNVSLTKGIAGSVKVRTQPFLFLICNVHIILGGSEYPVYPINSCGSYPSNASYHDDVIERDMFRYPTTKIHFPGAFHISNRNYMQIRHHANRWYALM